MDLRNEDFFSLLRKGWEIYWGNLGPIWHIYAFSVFASLFYFLLNPIFDGVHSVPGYASMVVSIIAVSLFSILVEIALFIQINKVVEGNPGTVQSVFFEATPIYWQYLFTTLIYGFLIMGSFILLIIPALIMGVFWTFYKQAVVYRNKNYMDALGYSFSLVKGQWFRVALYIVGFIVITSPFIALTYVFETAGVAVNLLATIILLFVSGWLLVTQVLFFFHLEQSAGLSLPENLSKQKDSKSVQMTKPASKGVARKKRAVLKKQTAKKSAPKRKVSKKKSARKSSSKKRSSKNSKRK